MLPRPLQRPALSTAVAASVIGSCIDKCCRTIKISVCVCVLPAFCLCECATVVNKMCNLEMHCSTLSLFCMVPLFLASGMQNMASSENEKYAASCFHKEL